MAEQRNPRRLTLAEKIDHLFRAMHPARRGEHTYEEVAEGIRQRGTSISASYIWMLRKGTQDNPSKKHLEALADFFKVPVKYFFDDEAAAQIDAELELLGAMRDAGVKDIALHAAELTPDGRRAIAAMIEQVRQLQGGEPRAAPAADWDGHERRSGRGDRRRGDRDA